MFMEQPVAVIGGGDAALDEALYLTQYASQGRLCTAVIRFVPVGSYRNAHR